MYIIRVKLSRIKVVRFEHLGSIFFLHLCYYCCTTYANEVILIVDLSLLLLLATAYFCWLPPMQNLEPPVCGSLSFVRSFSIHLYPILPHGNDFQLLQACICIIYMYYKEIKINIYTRATYSHDVLYFSYIFFFLLFVLHLNVLFYITYKIFIFYLPRLHCVYKWILRNTSILYLNFSIWQLCLNQKQ